MAHELIKLTKAQKAVISDVIARGYAPEEAIRTKHGNEIVDYLVDNKMIRPFGFGEFASTSAGRWAMNDWRLR